MPAGYSLDLRKRIVAAHKSGKSQIQIARLFSVSDRSVRRYLRLEQSGKLAPKTTRLRNRKLEPYSNLLKEILGKAPDATLKEIAEQLPINVSIHCLWIFLKIQGYTFKKSSSRR